MEDYERMKSEIHIEVDDLTSKVEEVGDFDEREQQEALIKNQISEQTDHFFLLSDSLYSALNRGDKSVVSSPLMTSIKDSYKALSETINQERLNESDELEEKELLADELSSQSAILMISSCAVSFFLSLFLGIYLAQRISGPLSNITQSINAFVKGDSTQKIEVRTKNELGELGHFINSIYLELNEHREYLEKRLATKRQKLRESEEKYRLISNNMTDLITLCEPSGKLTFCTPSVKTLLGYEAEDVIDQNLMKFIHPDEVSYVLATTNDLLKSKEPVKIEYHLKHAEGFYLWVETIISGIFDKDEPVQFQMSTRDITSRKIAEQALVESLEKERHLNQLKSRFVAMASHQFRTPLTVIQSNIELLNMHAERDLDKKTFIKNNRISTRIQREVSRMTDLMNDVLILGKINSKEMTKKAEPVDMLDLVEEFKDQSQFATEDERILDIKVLGEPEPILCDRTQIGHVLMNLIANAFKYSSESKANPELVLDFTGGNFLKMSITDYGIGIPSNELDEVFTPFFRADNVGDLPGTGLGLNIVKEYVELNNGKVEVQSELNKKTTFTVFLPKSKPVQS